MIRGIGANPHLKVLAFTLTTLLYFFVVGENATSREFTLALRVGHLPPDTVVLNELPPVRVRLRASARAFARLEAESLRVLTIDVDDVTQTRWELRQTDLGLPGHVTVEEIAPSWVELGFDTLEQRALPVRALVRGVPARGYEASAAVVTPEAIVVSAPSTYFVDLDAVFTDSVDISGATGAVEANVPLAIQRPFVTFPLDRTVAVRVEVDAVVERRVLDGVPMLVTGPGADRCAVDVGSIEVTVTGPETVVDAMNPYDLIAGVACAEYADQGAGIYTPSPAIENLPPSVQVVETSPRVVRVTVRGSAEGSGGARPGGALSP